MEDDEYTFEDLVAGGKSNQLDYTFEDLEKGSTKEETDYTFEDLVAGSKEPQKESPEIDANLGGQFVHGLETGFLRGDQADALKDVQTFQNLKPYLDILKDVDAETQAFTDAGFPEGYLNLTPAQQSAWQLETHPGGLPPELDALVKGRMQATMATDVDDPRTKREYVLKQLMDTTNALNAHAAAGPRIDEEGLRNIMSSRSFWESVKAISENPKGALQVSMQSLGEVAPLMVIGSLAMIVSGGTGGVLQEITIGEHINTMFGISEVLEKYGIDPNNAEQMAALIDDPKFMQTLMRESQLYGAAHVAVEAPLSYIFGKFVKIPGVNQFDNAWKRIAKSALKTTAAVGTGAITESGGEGFALTAIDQGPDKNPEFWPKTVMEGTGRAPMDIVTRVPATVAEVIGPRGRPAPGAPPPPARGEETYPGEVSDLFDREEAPPVDTAEDLPDPTDAEVGEDATTEADILNL